MSKVESLSELRVGLYIKRISVSHRPALTLTLPAKGGLAHPKIAHSRSTNAVSFSSARATRRFPVSRCASAIQIVCPLESIAETQPQLQPALLRLSAMIS